MIHHIFSESREDVEEDGTIGGRKSVMSTIKFRPTSRDNQVHQYFSTFYSSGNSDQILGSRGPNLRFVDELSYT